MVLQLGLGAKVAVKIIFILISISKDRYSFLCFWRKKSCFYKSIKTVQPRSISLKKAPWLYCFEFSFLKDYSFKAFYS